MNLANIDFFQILLIAFGIYGIYRGINILTTGRLPEREEASVKDFSENGLRRYKMLQSILNIICGVLIIIFSIIRLMNLMDMNMFRIIGLSIVAVLIVVFLVVRNSCKNEK